MVDQELLDYLKEYKDLMEQCLNRVDALEDEFYKITSQAADAENEYNLGKRRDDFKSKYGEQLSSFNEKLKAIEGDDFDLTEKAFNDFEAITDDENKDSDKYVAELIAKVQSQLEKISKAFGGGNIEVEAKDEDKDGKVSEITVEADTNDNGEGDKAVAKAEDIVEKKDEEEKSGDTNDKEEKVEEIIEEDDDEEDKPEEVEADLKELEEEYNRLYK